MSHERVKLKGATNISLEMHKEGVKFVFMKLFIYTIFRSTFYISMTNLNLIIFKTKRCSISIITSELKARKILFLLANTRHVLLALNRFQVLQSYIKFWRFSMNLLWNGMPLLRLQRFSSDQHEFVIFYLHNYCRRVLCNFKQSFNSVLGPDKIN